MALLNSDIPYFRALVRRSYYTHNPEHEQILDPVCVFGAQCVTNRIFTFHCMFDFGMVRSRVPISALYWKEPTGDIEPHFKELWDCFGEQFAITQFEYLKGKRCQVVLKDGSKIWATYQFTVDWYGNSFSENPLDYKNGHVLFADDGFLLCQPNNRIYWKDQNFVIRPFPIDPKEIKVDRDWLRVETFSDRWVSENSDSFYYDILRTTDPCPAEDLPAAPLRPLADREAEQRDQHQLYREDLVEDLRGLSRGPGRSGGTAASLPT